MRALVSQKKHKLRKYLEAHDAPCPECGYNLCGLKSDMCPECGLYLPDSGMVPFDNRNSRSIWVDVRRAIKSLAIIVLCVLAVLFLTCAYTLINPSEDGGISSFW